MSACIGISLGDITGIGPEVTLKALAQFPADDPTTFLILGDPQCLHETNEQLGLKLTFHPFQKEGPPPRFAYVNAFAEKLPCDLVPGSPAASRAAVAWLRDGAGRCLRHDLDALVTAPVSKEAILRTGQPFIGQTEYLSELAGTQRTAMMLVGEDLNGHWVRVSLATTHVALRLVPDHLQKEQIEMVLELTARACLDLGLSRSRIGVCGLNPHAGEGGALGNEEMTIITPAIAAAKRRGYDVHGPYPADSLFHHAFRGDYDAVVAMYHDQGLVPLKMVAFETGVNWTLGLPFIRTSPDHGTAYNIAGKNKANPSSMLRAIKLAKQLALRTKHEGQPTNC
jgi:4-hydroxythreonine-4-phosphate dehydrogenase